VDLDTSIVAGIDEVGRGCIAGPVVAAIVILDPANPIAGLKDSKTISPRRRTLLSQCILEKALDWSIGRAEVSEITSINILQATLLAMQRAYQGLHITPDWVWACTSPLIGFGWMVTVTRKFLVKGTQLYKGID